MYLPTIIALHRGLLQLRAAKIVLAGAILLQATTNVRASTTAVSSVILSPRRPAKTVCKTVWLATTAVSIVAGADHMRSVSPHRIVCGAGIVLLITPAGLYDDEIHFLRISICANSVP